MKRIVPHLLALAALAVVGLLQAAAPAQAQPAPPPAVALLSGAWEMTGQDGQRKCRLTLRPAEVKGGRVIGFPTACRRTLPVLGKVAAWSVSDDGFVRLMDAGGAVVLAFEDDPAAMMLKGTADGAEYRLDPMGRARRFVARASAPPAPRAPFDPATAPPRESIPGSYAMYRQGGQEVCRITLGTSPGAAEGRFLTNFPTRCRDRGLQVFDVVAWRYAGGRIFLIARRGHEMTMVSSGAGEWRKEPAGNAELVLRRIGD